MSNINLLSVENLYTDLAPYIRKKENFDEYCATFNLVKGLKVGTNISMEHNDLAYLLDHLFLFETTTGKRYYVSNTYMTTDEIAEVLIKCNLVGRAMIIGEGFWNHKTTAVLFDSYYLTQLSNMLYHFDITN